MTQKYFLDTSIYRPLLLSSRHYKKFLLSQIDPEMSYISQFIIMEFNRSFLCNVINFYFVLSLPTIDTVNDAIAFWSNKFKGSELKAALQLISQLLTLDIDHNSKSDKKNALLHLLMVIKRFEAKSRLMFKDAGQDGTYCVRGSIRLKLTTQNPEKGLKQFNETFADKTNCRSGCKVDNILLNRFKIENEKYITQANSLPKNQNTRGFKNIAINLHDVITNGAKACSCDKCAKIGDAIISLNSPRTMVIAHTDNSFDYLCDSIKQPHQKFLSEQKVVNPTLP